MRKVKCPLLNKEIDGDKECFDIAMVAENNAPESTVSKEVSEIKNYRNICLECPNHICN